MQKVLHCVDPRDVFKNFQKPFFLEPKTPKKKNDEINPQNDVKNAQNNVKNSVKLRQIQKRRRMGSLHFCKLLWRDRQIEQENNAYLERYAMRKTHPYSFGVQIRSATGNLRYCEVRALAQTPQSENDWKLYETPKSMKSMEKRTVCENYRRMNLQVG